jgi:hypothetical protein
MKKLQRFYFMINLVYNNRFYWLNNGGGKRYIIKQRLLKFYMSNKYATKVDGKTDFWYRQNI